MSMFTPLRRGAVLITALVASALALSGCVSETTNTEATTAPASSEGTFPVTLDTAYGEITVPEKPERIVVLTANWVDILTSIDEQPIAFWSGLDNEEDLIDQHPWLDGLYTGEHDPGLVTAEYKAAAEAIAAYEPDLILSNIWMIDEQDYEQLSKIAPVYAGQDAAVASTLEDNLTAAGVLTGKSANASQVLTGIDEEHSAAQSRLSGLQGKTFNSGIFRGGAINLTDLGAESMVGLGLVPAEGQPIVAPKENITVSLENVDQLDADVLMMGIWPTPDAEEILESDPRFLDLPASQNDTLVYFDVVMANAGSGPAGYLWLLENLVSQLEDSIANQGTGVDN